MNTFRSSYNATLYVPTHVSYTSRAFEACSPCKPGDWLCGAMKWGCDVQHATAESVLGQSHAIQQGTSDAVKSTIDASKSTDKYIHDSIFGTSNAVQQTAGGIGKTITDSVLGTANAVQQGFGSFGQFLPFIGIGLGIILLIVLLKR